MMDDRAQNSLWLTLDNTPQPSEGPNDQLVKACHGPSKRVCVPSGGSYLVFLESILYEGRAGTSIALIRNDYKYCLQLWFRDP